MADLTRSFTSTLSASVLRAPPDLEQLEKAGKKKKEPPGFGTSERNRLITKGKAIPTLICKMGVFTDAHPVHSKRIIVGESNKIVTGDFPGGPVVKISHCFSMQGARVEPWLGN